MAGQFANVTGKKLRIARSLTLPFTLIFFLNKIINEFSIPILPAKQIDGPSLELSNLTQNAKAPQHHHLERLSNLSDDEPLYDAVASDDDYAALTPTLNQAAAAAAASSSAGQPQQVTQAIKTPPLKLNSIG